MNTINSWLKWIGSVIRDLGKALLPGSSGTTGQPDHLLDTLRIVRVMQPLVLIGIVLIGIDTGRLASKAILASLACLAAGLLTGFLFGIPKVLQGGVKKTQDSDAVYRQKVNTNLEEISDWLTKIIVGLGLVELKRIPSVVSHLASLLAMSFPDPSKEHAVFCCAIVFFTTCGFLIGYLVTRLYLQGALGRADSAATPDIPFTRKKMAMSRVKKDGPEVEKTSSDDEDARGVTDA